MAMVKPNFRQVRRAPTSPEGAAYNNAADRWDADADWVDSDRAGAGTRRTTAGGQADSAVSGVTGYRATNTEGFRPNELSGFDPSEYYDLDDMGGAGGAGAARGSRTASYKPGATAGYASTELTGYSADDVSNFDPSQYGKEFAGGAYGDFKNQLGDELKGLAARSVAGGRINTGFFDEDQGGVVTRLGSDFSNKLAQAAVQFSGQRLDALGRGADLRFQRASGIDRNMLEAARSQDELGLNAAESADSMDLDYAQLEETAAGRRQAGRGDAARLAFERASRLDDMGSDRARYLDDMGYDARKTALDAALGRERLSSDEYQRNADRASEYTSATRDWAAADRDYRDSRSDRADEVRRRDRMDADERLQRNTWLEPQVSRYGVPTGYRRRYVQGGSAGY